MSAATLGEGLARYLAARGVGAFSTAEPLPEGAPGIYLEAIPDDGAIISISVRPVADDPTESWSVLAAVITCRHEDRHTARATQDLAEDVHQALNGFRGLLANGVRVTVAWRQGGALPEPDASERCVITATYYVRITAPGPHLL